MNSLLPFIISGLVTGAVFGMAGTGLAMSYKASGVFNFGYGAMSTVAVYVFYWLHITHRVNWIVSFVLSVFVLGAIMGLAMERVAVKLAAQPLIYKVVGTVGIVVAVRGAAVLWYGSDPLSIPDYLPHGTDTFSVGSFDVTYTELIIFCVALFAMVGLYALFRFTRTGTAMRAVVDDDDLLSITGIDPIRVRRIAWIVGSTFATLSGVLIAPSVGLDALILTQLVVQAFAAAAIGAFSSIPLTYAGGFIIGIAGSVGTKYAINVDWLSAVPSTVPFILLVIALLVIPRRKLAGQIGVEKPPPLPYKGRPISRLTAGIIVFSLLAMVPQFAGPKLPFFSVALSLSVVILSLGLLVRTSGQLSLCHTAFMAIGACAFYHYRVTYGLPWLVSLLLAGLTTVPVGALIAIPAIRLPGLFLALATYGFGLMMENLFYSRALMFGSHTQGREILRPSIATGDSAYYMVVLVAFALTALVMVAIHEGRLGRILRGIAGAPQAVATMGLSTSVTRFIVFCISAFFAAIGGVLYGGSIGFASLADTYFSSFYALVLLATLAIAPFREPWYVLPVFAGAAIQGYWNNQNSPYWLDVIFGVSAVIVAMHGGNPAMPERARKWLDRVFGSRRVKAPRTVSDVRTRVSITMTNLGSDLGAARIAADSTMGLQICDLTVKFGGLVAVNGLSMSAPTRRITGLIGPNGAGKTTTFNMASGVGRPNSGRILFHGKDISRLSAGARGRLGLGRTFQRADLCEALTVAENVALGREAGQAGRHTLRQMVAPPSERKLAKRATDEALDLCGIAHLAGRQAGGLSTGERRLVELARCLAGPFDMLLLDEPSSGLDRSETELLGALLRQIERERGCGILLVEHDVALVTEICSYIYVLDFGTLLAAGSPDAVASNPDVQAAYLGTQEVDEEMKRIASLQVRGANR